MNDTLGPDGPVPSGLVFVECPYVYTRSENSDPHHTLESRAEVANMSGKEMKKQTAVVRAQRAFIHKVPSGSDDVLQIGQMVFVWRGKVVVNRIGE